MSSTKPTRLAILVGIAVAVLAAFLPHFSRGSDDSTIGVSTASSSSGSTISSAEVKVDGIIKSIINDEYLLDQEVKRAYESAKRTLANYNEAKANLIKTSTDVIEGNKSATGIAKMIQDVEEKKHNVSETKKRINASVRDINARQILDLKKKVELIHKRELERRAKMKEKEEFEKKRLESLQKSSAIPDGAITKDELGDLIDVKSLIDKSDEELESWFLEMVEQEVEALQGELEETVIEATTALGDMIEASAEETDTVEEHCSGATLADAVQLVQESLVKFANDKVGMKDHLARAKVVHHLTSNNYVPPSSTYFPLELSWWFRYLPEDWERGLDAIMPDGWRQWNAAIPDFVYHTFGMVRQAKTAPPEAILTPNIFPGSCWPMEGQSGQVTLRLPYPVKVKAVTLDHASALLFDDGKNDRNSAPKRLRVFGYPPCWTKKGGELAGSSSGGVKKSDYLDDYENDNNDDGYARGICENGLDFDVDKPIVLHDIEYDLEGPSIQTFYVPHPPSEDSEEDDDDDGSCSQDTGQCSGGLDATSSSGNNAFLFASPDRSDSINEGVGAIRLEILDNWGNDDYTCIYRFRVHGDAIDPTKA